MRRRQPSTDFLLMCRSLLSAPAPLNSLLVLCSSTEEAVQIQSRKRTKTLLGSFLGEKMVSSIIWGTPRRRFCLAWVDP